MNFRKIISETIDEYLDKNLIQVKKGLEANKAKPRGSISRWVDNPSDDVQIIKNQWMIHFSNIKTINNIAQQGFTMGNSYDETPESITYNRIKTENGFNYAYLATDILDFLNEPPLGFEPFKDFLINESQSSLVMFKGNGYRFEHIDDFEEQVVFNNIQRDTMVKILFLYDNYCVIDNKQPSKPKSNAKLKNTEQGLSLDKYPSSNNPKNFSNNIIYFSAELDKVIKWVMTNYEQYKNTIKQR